MRVTRLDEILERHAVPLFDAYGVLVDAAGARPGARERLASLRRAGRAFFVLTNDGSRLPESCAARYAALGLDVRAEEVISTAGLLAEHYRREGLVGARTLVLGPEDARAAVRAGGGELVTASEEVDALVIADEAFAPFMASCDDALSALVRALDRGRAVRLLLLNPDMLYPRGAEGFGFTAGAVARMFEGALAARYRAAAPAFVRLGKPHAPPFEEAVRRARTRDLVMIGDQLDTDIAGARDFGLPSALLLGGVGAWRGDADAPSPTYLVERL